MRSCTRDLIDSLLSFLIDWCITECKHNRIYYLCTHELWRTRGESCVQNYTVWKHIWTHKSLDMNAQQLWINNDMIHSLGQKRFYWYVKFGYEKNGFYVFQISLLIFFFCLSAWISYIFFMLAVNSQLWYDIDLCGSRTTLFCFSNFAIQIKQKMYW